MERENEIMSALDELINRVVNLTIEIKKLGAKIDALEGGSEK